MANPAYAKVYPFGAPARDAAGNLTEDDQRAQLPEWRHLAGAWGDGIVNNLGSTPMMGDFGAVRSAADRTVSIRLGEFRLRGIHFEPTDDVVTMDLRPVPAGATRTDRIVMRLNPAAKTMTIEQKNGTPVTSGTPPRPTLTRVAGGMWEFSLHTLTGANTAASTLAVEDNRVWVTASGLSGRGDPTDNLNLYGDAGVPYSTLYFDRATGCTWFQNYTGTTSAWVNYDAPLWRALPLAAGLTVNTVVPAYTKNRGWVTMRGDVKRANGADLATPRTDLPIATLPVGYRPGVNSTFPVAASYSIDSGDGKIFIGADGVVHFFSPGPGASPWAALDGIRFFAEN